MLKVYKYPIIADGYFDLELPENAQVLTVQTQFNEPYLWALVNPDLPTERRKFRLAGTGHPINLDYKNLSYINTFQLNQGGLVFHLFEVIPFVVDI